MSNVRRSRLSGNLKKYNTLCARKPSTPETFYNVRVVHVKDRLSLKQMLFELVQHESIDSLLTPFLFAVNENKCSRYFLVMNGKKVIKAEMCTIAFMEKIDQCTQTVLEFTDFLRSKVSHRSYPSFKNT